MNKLVISINPERLKYLNYNYTLIPGETEASDFVKSKMINKYNEDKNSKKYKGKCGCFTSHIKALEYAVDNKLKNIQILEDDAFLDSHDIIMDMPRDAPSLLGGVLQHPTDWKKTNDFKKNDVDDIISNFEDGINLIDYDKYRFTGSYAIFYPDYKCCQKILNYIFNSGKPLKHFDIYLCNNKLVKYLIYPSIYKHDDTKTGSSITNGEGIIKNYKKI